MSEKQVNIKITANTKDFNSAIDKAKKEIEGLAEALEKLSANKIGEKIEEQFSNLSKVIKELEDKINAIVGSFDKLDKTKLDKAEEGLEDTSKSINDLGKEYEKAQKSLEDLTKQHDEAISKQKELADTYEQSKVATKAYEDQIRKAEDAYNKANKAVSEHGTKIDQTKKKIEYLGKAYEDNKKDLEKFTKEYEKKQKRFDDMLLGGNSDATKDRATSLERINDRLKKELKELDETYKEAKKKYDKLEKDIEAQKLFKKTSLYDKKSEKQKQDLDTVLNSALLKKGTLEKQLEPYIQRSNELNKQIAENEKEIKSLREEIEKLDRTMTTVGREADELREKKKELAKVCNKFEQEIADSTKELDKMGKELGSLEKTADDAAKELDDLRKGFDGVKGKEDFNKKELDKAAQAVKNYKDAMDDAEGAIRRFNEEADRQAKEFDDHYKAYERLSKWVDKYISDESKAIALRAQVAESFEKVAKAMEGVYADSKKLDNMEKINKVLQESKEYLKDFDLVSLDNVNEELDRFSKRLETTIEKQKRYKAVAKEFGTDDGKEAYRIQKKAEALKEWADSADFVIQASDKLSKAWGNISAAGEDNLQIRERSKMIDEYGKTLKENVAHIEKYYKELKTLDEIYEKCTDEERATIDDYRYWEKNKEKLEDYNQAIRDYLSVIKESGGQISEKFLDDKGAFDIKKFIANYEKFGEANNILKKSMEALKVKTLASIEAMVQNADANEKAAREAKKNAEATLEQAKAAEKAAKTDEERAEAAKKVAKAEEELKNAKKELKKVLEGIGDADKKMLDDMDKLIKKFNEGAEAARKLGINMKDITKADIGKIDGGKPFASLLDDMETFGNNLPKTFGEVSRQIKALFADMEGLNFDSVLSGLKDLGTGVLSKIPTELKVAAGAALALGAALKECAEIGINQFTRGMDTISNALSGLVGIARSVGTEIRDAFENITGMHMDFSSLMEIPVDFESQMAKVGAIAGVDKLSEDFKKLEEEARRLGAITRYSATEVAEAMEYMAMAGWGFDDIMRKSADGVTALESVLNLATVAQMDLGQASDFVTDGLTALGYEADKAADFVNILAAASTSSNTSVAQMQKAFTNCAPVAGTLGITMEDLSIALGLIADKGVKGAKAGTALKNLMANLSAPTEKQLAYIKQFNLEGAQQAIVNGNLIDGIKKMKAALKGLSPQQQNAVITTIAGKEALSGISALLNTTEEDLAELEDAIRNCDGAAQEMAGTMDDTLKGRLKGLASAMQETLLQIFDKTEKGIKDFTKQLTEFFHILNGFSDFGGLKGLEGALAFLENASQGWGKAIADGLTNAIGAIDNFVNSESFDNLLQVGTNIINGIADGIREAADNGTLDSAISTAIGKIATWFSENLDTIIEVGKKIIESISKGISENGDAIGEAIKAVMELQTTIDVAVTKEKWKLIGENLGTFICEGIGSKFKTFWAGLTGFITGTKKQGLSLEDMAGPAKDDPNMSLLNPDKAKEAYNKGGLFGKWKDTSNKDGKDAAKSFTDGINEQLNASKVGTDETAASIGQGISDNILAKLETMDTGDLAALREEMNALQTTVTSVGTAMSTSFTAIQDSARTSFMGLTNIIRNQMLNCTNIIRNQCINWYNIINNQVTNARNVLTSQFLSMAAVARTQMVNISNIIRNQAMAWANIIANQAKNARDALTRQFMSMAAVARTQMSKVASAVSSSMSNIVASTSRGISMNVNVNPYTNTGGASVASADALYAANSASTFSLGRNMSALASGASSAVSSGNTASNGGGGRSSNNGIRLEIPVMLDGKEVARATASYVNEELKTITNRENRKRGAK